jgi:hypothetical protein
MYADRNHLRFRDQIVNELKQKNIFKRYILKTRSDLTNTNFYIENKQILDCSRGYGYCAWKP